MKEIATQKLFGSITNVNDQFVEESRSRAKRNNPAWVRFGAIAACLCLVLGAVFAIPKLNPAIPENGGYADAGNDGNLLDGDPNGYSAGGQTSNNGEESQKDHPAMVMIDGQIYKDSGEILATLASIEKDGQITSSCDNVPAENNQSNFGSGYNYHYGENKTINVQFEDGWHIFVPYEVGESTDAGNDGNLLDGDPNGYSAGGQASNNGEESQMDDPAMIAGE